ncbi:MAG: YeaH/YhbH family protein [Caulobacterales bacterium]|jgi:uncharacterized sporulation protein YeaH/YhbH (DUF444 family)
MHIIDRRLNPGGKSLANRQRFIRRARALVRRAVHDASAKRSIKDLDQGGDVSIPADGVSEPSLRRAGQGGVRDYLLPGNKKFVEGDEIERPDDGQGGGGGPGQGGDGEDEFQFALTREEFLELFLEDLELPDLVKREVMGEAVEQPRRAGYRTSGPPSAISVSRTMRNSLSRRLALGRPSLQDIEAAQAALSQAEATGAKEEALAPLRAELDRLQRRARLIPYIDPLDVRYRRFEQVPRPIAKAVMFCVMDVSGSMDEHMKDLAKRFYTLLYLFLTRRYGHVDVVFIRHTHEAQEVDEQTFFHARETGGTVVSTALALMLKVLRDRYPPHIWNIYAAQASDGDNTLSDNAISTQMLTDQILPMCQYFAYLEVGPEDDDIPLGGRSGRPTSLWRAYETLLGDAVPMAMRKVRHRRDIYPVFRDLFRRKAQAATS